MQPLRLLRGVFGTALVWATLWTVAGGVLSILPLVLGPGGAQWIAAPYSLLRVAQTAAVGFGVLGAVVGGAFALALAVTGRRQTFADLTPRRVAASGVFGGLVVACALLLRRIIVIGPPERAFIPDLVIAAVLGGTTAWLMLRLARRAPSLPSPDALSSGDRWAPEAAGSTSDVASVRPT